jgi:predicted nucleotidyltransferase
MLETRRRYTEAVKSFTNRAVRELGDRIDAIILYGSAARNEADENSDIDVLIITAHLEIRERVYDIAYDVNLEYDVLLSFFFIDRERFLRLLELGSPFAENILAEGVVLYERDRVFKGIRAQAAGTG